MLHRLLAPQIRIRVYNPVLALIGSLLCDFRVTLRHPKEALPVDPEQAQEAQTLCEIDQVHVEKHPEFDKVIIVDDVEWINVPQEPEKETKAEEEKHTDERVLLIGHETIRADYFSLLLDAHHEEDGDGCHQ